MKLHPTLSCLSVFQALNSDTPLYEAIHDLVETVLSNKSDDLRYRDHLAITKKKYRHFNNDPLVEEVLNDLTNFAAKIVCDEMITSEAESRNPTLHETTLSSCSCTLFKSLHISCRHIMRKRREEGKYSDKSCCGGTVSPIKL